MTKAGFVPASRVQSPQIQVQVQRCLISTDAKRALDSAAAAYRIRNTNVTKAKKKGVRSVGIVQQPLEVDEAAGTRRLETHRASAFSTAESYDFNELLPILEEKYILLPFIADDVFHIRLQDATNNSEAFFFSNGVVVTWGTTDLQIEELLLVANQVGLQKYHDLEVEWFDYSIDREHQGGILNDTIIIGSDLPADQYKLAFSSGLARSAKLASLENLLDAHLHKNRAIPDLLLKGKKLPLGRHAILKSLGELFSLRGHVNLHSELLDLPDFCWSSPKMEDAFSSISRNLDVRARITIFNKKLDYANELAEVLRNHLHEEHSLKLEWAIIVLITIEILFEVVHYWEKTKAKEEEATEEQELLNRRAHALERKNRKKEEKEQQTALSNSNLIDGEDS
ncbi:UNVERIFIED_CONTAM: hypothetical protein HDU68_001896 [Siphonaria sp. JEL0065]|nr:hypothetical protein HDU68_001896 [Siphonaria sp. JEL0065]